MAVIIFTARYPFGNGEAFLESELPYWREKQDKVYLIPLDPKGNVRNSFDSAQYELILLDAWEGSERLSWGARMHILSRELVKGNLRMSQIRNHLRLLRNAEVRADQLDHWIEAQGISRSEDHFYSYWLDEWATTLSILRLQGRISSFISRAHGFDLYFERHEDRTIPLRQFQMKWVHQVFAVSRFGKEYLIKAFPSFREKIFHSYLGTKDHQPKEQELPRSEENHIVSCSAVKPVKRVDLILSELQHLENVKWTHIGGGEGFHNLERDARNAVLPENTEIDLRGNMDHVEIMEFYGVSRVSCFVNVSESEGIPVSIMEALSFGIPIVATDVGGVREIVTEDVGVLLEKNFATEDFVSAVNDVQERFCSKEARLKIRSIWSSTFSAETNYRAFVSRFVRKDS